MELPETAGHLDGPVSRRLWLLRMLVERMEPEAALALAERMKNFIAGTTAAAAMPGNAQRCARPADENTDPATDRVRATITAQPTAAVSPSGGRLLGGRAAQRIHRDGGAWRLESRLGTTLRPDGAAGERRPHGTGQARAAGSVVRSGRRKTPTGRQNCRCKAPSCESGHLPRRRSTTSSAYCASAAMP